jgi:hypothetical protein
MGKVMKRDGGLVEAMGGCRPPTPAPAGWVRPLRPVKSASLCSPPAQGSQGYLAHKKPPTPLETP